METHTTVVGPDGMIHLPTDEARPGQTVIVTIIPDLTQSMSTSVQHQDQATVMSPAIPLAQMSPSDQQDAISDYLDASAHLRQRLPMSRRTSNHDWLYDEHGLPT